MRSSLLLLPRSVASIALGALLLLTSTWGQAADQGSAERAARAAAAPWEAQGYAFRAESWVRDLAPDVGKAIRVQLFKGLDYRFAVAVPAQSGASVAAAVLDSRGKEASRVTGKEAEAPALVLSIKPKKTGVYMIVVRQAASQAPARTVSCCVLTGFK
jgi:hypothetical protein